MGDRGPKPETKIHVLPAQKNKRKSPIPGMTKPACRIWTKVMGDYDPDHFLPQHYGILRAYCEAEAAHNRAIKGVAEGGDIIKQENGVVKENPYVNMEIKFANLMSQLGTKLGITKNATTVSRGDKSLKPKPKSKRDGLMGGQ